MSGLRGLPTSTRLRPKATFELNLYVFPNERPSERHSDRCLPRTDEHAPVTSFVHQAVQWLREREIVGGTFDDELGWLAPGAHSGRLFDRESNDYPSFEYLILRDESTYEFVPNAHMGRFGASCPSCGSSLDDVVHEYLERQGSGLIRDVRREPFRCQGCSLLIPPGALQCDIETGVTKTYLNFCHVESDALSPKLVAELEGFLGSSIRQVQERL